MKIVILVSAERGRRCLESLYECISNRDHITVFTFLETPWEPRYVESIKELAKKHKSGFYITSKVHDDKYTKIWSNEVDVIFAIGWRYLIPRQVYKSARRGCYIFHDSYLPKNRGFSPTVWSIRDGDRYTGVSIFKINEKVDEGPIIFQEKVFIDDNEYISDVMEKVTKKYEKLIKKLYHSINSNSLTFTEQNHNNASYRSMLCPDDFQIDWRKGASEIYNLIRSYSFPYSGAYTFFNKKKLYILSAKIAVFPSYSECIVGKIASFNNDNSLTVLCGNSSAIKLCDIYMDGKKVINFDKVNISGGRFE